MCERDKKRADNQRIVVDALTKRIQSQSEDLINKYKLCLEMEEQLKKQKEQERKEIQQEVIQRSLELQQSENKAMKLQFALESKRFTDKERDFLKREQNYNQQIASYQRMNQDLLKEIK